MPAFQDDAFVHGSGRSKRRGSSSRCSRLAETWHWSPFATLAGNREADSRKVLDAAPTREYYTKSFRQDPASVVVELLKLKDKPSDRS